MLFWLKKFIGHWLMPVPFCLLLFVLGLVLLLRKSSQAGGKRLLLLAVLLFAIFSHSALSGHLLRSLEDAHPPVPELVAGAPLPPPLARCQYIIVLGSGHVDDDSLPALNQLSATAVARITEAVRLARSMPQAKIITTGPGRPGRPTHADVLARSATELGLARERIVTIGEVRDTEDEANAVRLLVGSSPVALVTTAAHMRRAAALFRGAGIDVLPCPTGFMARRGPESSWTSWLWDSAALERSTAAMRERIGYTWVWLRRKV